MWSGQQGDCDRAKYANLSHVKTRLLIALSNINMNIMKVSVICTANIDTMWCGTKMCICVQNKKEGLSYSLWWPN